jgi:hypothetical protein
MPISTQQVQVAECDNCGIKRYSENGTYPVGVQGHAQQIDERGHEKNVKWFSCRSDAGHIGKAVSAALSRKDVSSADATTSQSSSRLHSQYSPDVLPS